MGGWRGRQGDGRKEGGAWEWEEGGRGRGMRRRKAGWRDGKEGGVGRCEVGRQSRGMGRRRAGQGDGRNEG